MHCLTLTRDRTISIAWPLAAAIALALCCNFPGRAFADPRTRPAIACQNFVRVLKDLPIDWPSSSLPMAWTESDQSVFILTKGHDQWRGLVRFDFVDSRYQFISTKLIDAPGSIVCSRDGSTVLCWNQQEIVIWRTRVPGLLRAVGYFPVRCDLSRDGRFAYFSGTMEVGLTPVPYGLYALRLDGPSPNLMRLDDPIEGGALKNLPSLLGVSSHSNRIYYLVESKPPRLPGLDLVIAELEDGLIKKSIALPYEPPLHASIGSASLDSDEYVAPADSNTRWAYLDEDRSLEERTPIRITGEGLRGLANWRAAQYVGLHKAYAYPTGCLGYYPIGSGEIIWIRYHSMDHVPTDFYDVIWKHGDMPRVFVPHTRGYSRMFISRNASYSVLLSEDRDGFNAQVIPLSRILEGIAEAALSPKGEFRLTPIK